MLAIFESSLHFQHNNVRMAEMKRTNHRSGVEATGSFSQEEFAFAAFDIACAEFSCVENRRLANGVSRELRQRILERGVEAVSQNRLALDSAALEARFSQAIDSCFESDCVNDIAKTGECVAKPTKRDRFTSRLAFITGVAVCTALLCTAFAVFFFESRTNENSGYAVSVSEKLPPVHEDLKGRLSKNGVANQGSTKTQPKMAGGDSDMQTEDRSMRFAAVKRSNSQRWGEIVWDSQSQSGQATLHGLRPNFDTNGIRLWRYRLWINEDIDRSGDPVEAAEFDVANGEASIVVSVSPRSHVDQVESFHLSSEPVVADGSTDVEERISKNERIATSENDVILEFEASELR